MSHYDGVFGVNSSVRDPVLLSQGMRSVHDDLVCFVVISSRRLHLDCVIAVTQLGEGEATNVIQCIDSFRENWNREMSVNIVLLADISIIRRKGSGLTKTWGIGHT